MMQVTAVREMGAPRGVVVELGTVMGRISLEDHFYVQYIAPPKFTFAHKEDEFVNVVSVTLAGTNPTLLLQKWVSMTTC
jgi:hypothetical protein